MRLPLRYLSRSVESLVLTITPLVRHTPLDHFRGDCYINFCWGDAEMHTIILTIRKSDVEIPSSPDTPRKIQHIGNTRVVSATKLRNDFGIQPHTILTIHDHYDAVKQELTIVIDNPNHISKKLGASE